MVERESVMVEPPVIFATSQARFWSADGTGGFVHGLIFCVSVVNIQQPYLYNIAGRLSTFKVLGQHHRCHDSWIASRAFLGQLQQFHIAPWCRAQLAGLDSLVDMAVHSVLRCSGNAA